MGGLQIIPAGWLTAHMGRAPDDFDNERVSDWVYKLGSCIEDRYSTDFAFPRLTFPRPRSQIVNARREVAVASAEPSRRNRGELDRAVEDERKWSKSKATHCGPATIFGYKSKDAVGASKSILKPSTPEQSPVAGGWSVKELANMAAEPKREDPDIAPRKPDIQPEPRPEEIPQNKDVPEKETPPML
jgi:hypothetical protein